MRRYRRKRLSKKESDSIFMLAFYVGIIALVWTVFKRLFESAKTITSEILSSPIAMGVCSVVIALACWAWFLMRRRNSKAEQKFQQSLNMVAISDDRSQYIIENSDYKRGTPKENHFRRAYKLTLLSTFDNRCAKCSSNDNGVDIDHFVISKNEGGSFIMRHRDGHLVNNAIPLCQSCNRSKSDIRANQFFSQEELLVIFEKNVKMTTALNQSPIFDDEGQLLKTLRKRA